MSICKSIFQKEIYELQIEDLTNYFTTPQEETSILEFKSGEVELESVYKEVTAFLNTEGGLLIIGAPREIKVEKRNICQGSLVPATKLPGQDSLMQSIASHISPSPAGIKATSFDYKEGKIFVLEIPQSVNPPHQATGEGKYYIRFERQAKPAPHGIVEALFNRRQRARLRGDVVFLLGESSKTVTLLFSLKNESLISAEGIRIMIDVYGLKTVRRIKNMNFDSTVRDDKLIVQEILSENLLVRGLHLRFELEVELRSDFFFCSFQYYCKDANLEMVSKLFSIKEKKSLEIFETSISDDQSKISDNAFFEYSKIKEGEILSFFNLQGVQKTQTERDVILTHIFELSNSLGIEFPDSFITFLCMCNGFKGEIRSRHIHLFSINEVLDFKKKMGYDENKQLLTIGKILDNFIFLNFSDPEKCFLSILIFSNILQKVESRNFQSFFELMEYLNP